MEENEILDDLKNNQEETFEIAGLGKRLIHYLADSMVIYFLWYLASMILLQFYDLPEESQLLIVYLLLLAIYFPYYVLFEYFRGQTIGKIITGAEVVDDEGYKPSFWRILLRTVCRLIPLEIISFLFGDVEGWHDLISKTHVVVPANGRKMDMR